MDQLAQLKEKISVSPAEALFLVGYSGSVGAAQKSTYNLVSRGEFPFPIREVRFGNRKKRVVLVADIYSALGVAAPAPTLGHQAASAPAAPRRGPGRPRSLSQRGQQRD